MMLSISLLNKAVLALLLGAPESCWLMQRFAESMQKFRIQRL